MFTVGLYASTCRTSCSSVPRAPAAARFRRNLLAWYRNHGRDLPWRNTADPYHILVSEIMLQQTQVDRVLPEYHEWLGKYPRSLSSPRRSRRKSPNAAPARLQHPARRLQSIAQQAVEKYDGRLPWITKR